MSEDWNQSSNGLPRDGEQIEFVLDGRTVAMHGTYALPAFHSHWAEYGVDRVRSWRKLSPKLDLAGAESDQAMDVFHGSRVDDTSPLHFFFAGGRSHVA